MSLSAEHLLNLLLLAQDSATRMRNHMGPDWQDAAGFLSDFAAKRFSPLIDRCDRAGKSRYTVSLVGLTNVGKSTLTQALLGEAIAPRKNGPATAIPVEYEYGDRWHIIVYSEASQSIDEYPCDTPAEVVSRLKPLAMDADPEQIRTTARILVRGPIPLLRNTGLVFADTPGFGAAQLGDAAGTHEEKLIRYIEHRVDEVYFCVSASNGVVSGPEKDFFQKVAPRCSTIVVNKWEATPGKEQAEMRDYQTRFSRIFPLRQFVFTEAKEAIAAGRDGDAERHRQSGLPDLHELIRDRADPERRRRLVNAELRRAMTDLHAMFAHRHPGKKIPWHPTTLARVKSALPAELASALG